VIFELSTTFFEKNSIGHVSLQMTINLHFQIADLLQQFILTKPGLKAIFAPECNGNHRLPLFSRQKRCREENFCWVDAVLIGPAKTVVGVIEIEQSGIPKPALLGGKLLPLALCHFLNHETTGALPLDNRLIFIQVVNLEHVKPSSKKPAQYACLQSEVSKLLPLGSVTNYEIIIGPPGDFNSGASGAVSLYAALERVRI
jgi:hypothetical protein